MVRINRLLTSVGAAVRFRVESDVADLEASWAEHFLRERTQGLRMSDRVPWCEVSIFPDTGGVCSYGGEVWPMAWPQYFELRGWGYNQGTYLTAEGRVVFGLEAEDGEEPGGGRWKPDHGEPDYRDLHEHPTRAELNAELDPDVDSRAHRVAVLCGCGWGSLAMPEDEVPAACPLCGQELRQVGDDE